MEGIKNFLTLINNNWTTIIAIVGLCIAIYQKAKSFLSKTKEEKIKIAKESLKEVILGYVTTAEFDWEDYVKAGSIKRAEVIGKIYADFPILSKVVEQETLIAEIDTLIKDALVELKKVIEAQ